MNKCNKNKCYGNFQKSFGDEIVCDKSRCKSTFTDRDICECKGEGCYRRCEADAGNEPLVMKFKLCSCC